MRAAALATRRSLAAGGCVARRCVRVLRDYRRGTSVLRCAYAAQRYAGDTVGDRGATAADVVDGEASKPDPGFS